MRGFRSVEIAISVFMGYALLMPLETQAGLLGPSNFFECVLSRMPGAANDTVGYEIVGRCSKEFPGNIPVKKQTGFLATFRSGSECTLKKAKDTQSQWAANMIRSACYALYEPESHTFNPALLVPEK
jgi:hypothetical protein